MIAQYIIKWSQLAGLSIENKDSIVPYVKLQFGEDEKSVLQYIVSESLIKAGVTHQYARYVGLVVATAVIDNVVVDTAAKFTTLLVKCGTPSELAFGCGIFTDDAIALIRMLVGRRVGRYNVTETSLTQVYLKRNAII